MSDARSSRGGLGSAAGRFALALAAVGVTGCCQTTPPASQFPDAEAALTRMRDTYACANGIQGEGRLDHISEQGRVRGEVLLFAINPARVRIDVISAFGAALYSLTSNGKDFQMLDFQEKRFLFGPASACNLARMTQVEVPGHVLVWLLRGEAPVLVHEPGSASIGWDCGHYVVQVPSKHGAEQTIHLEPYDDDFDKPWGEQRLRVTRVKTEQQGAVLYDAVLSDHELAKTAPPRVDEDGLVPPIPPSGPECNVEIPREIEISVPYKGDDVLFTYEKVHFNPPIPAGAFSQPVPAGVTQVPVTCGPSSATR